MLYGLFLYRETKRNTQNNNNKIIDINASDIWYIV